MNSIYRRKTIKPDLSDPIKRKQWYRDKIYMFMHNKYSDPEARKIFYEKLQIFSKRPCKLSQPFQNCLLMHYFQQCH